MAERARRRRLVAVRRDRPGNRQPDRSQDLVKVLDLRSTTCTLWLDWSDVAPCSALTSSVHLRHSPCAVGSARQTLERPVSLRGRPSAPRPPSGGMPDHARLVGSRALTTGPVAKLERRLAADHPRGHRAPRSRASRERGGSPTPPRQEAPKGHGGRVVARPRNAGQMLNIQACRVQGPSGRAPRPDGGRSRRGARLAGSTG